MSVQPIPLCSGSSRINQDQTYKAARAEGDPSKRVPDLPVSNGTP